MKTITFFMCCIIFSGVITIQAQCSQDVTGFGNNAIIPSYNISGEVHVVLNNDDTITVNLESDFSTADGPDVRIYFLNSNGASDTALISGMVDDFENIQFGLLESFEGAQSFTVPIPEGTDISNFDIVYFYCLEFQQFWDYGNIEEPFTSNNCEALAIDEFIKEDFELFPNPAQTTVQIKKSEEQSSNFTIYNALGKIVLNKIIQAGVGQENVDISRLSAGVYFVTLSNTNQALRTTRKLIIR